MYRRVWVELAIAAELLGDLAHAFLILMVDPILQRLTPGLPFVVMIVDYSIFELVLIVELVARRA